MERQSLKETIMKFFNVDLPISGGYGSSLEDAITIEVDEARGGADMESTVLKYIHAFGGLTYRVVKQEFLRQNGRVYDKLELAVSNEPGRHKFYCFDVTQFHRE